MLDQLTPMQFERLETAYKRRKKEDLGEETQEMPPRVADAQVQTDGEPL